MALVDEATVGASLVAFGAPLLGWKADDLLSLEDALAAGVLLSKRNATVLRVLPALLAKRAKDFDWAALRKRAQELGCQAELGMLLELGGQMFSVGTLTELAVQLRPFARQEPEFYFAPKNEYDRRLARLNTPELARRWGFLMNMPLEAFKPVPREP